MYGIMLWFLIGFFTNFISFYLLSETKKFYYKYLFMSILLSWIGYLGIINITILYLIIIIDKLVEKYSDKAIIEYYKIIK